jgi:hypothetical protein
VQTETEQIESKAVLSKVAEKLNLDQRWAERHGVGNKAKAEDTVELLKQMTTVSTDPKSGFIDIKVKSEKAEEAARIANTIAEVYRDQRFEEKQRATIRGVENASKGTGRSGEEDCAGSESDGYRVTRDTRATCQGKREEEESQREASRSVEVLKKNLADIEQKLAARSEAYSADRSEVEALKGKTAEIKQKLALEEKRETQSKARLLALNAELENRLMLMPALPNPRRLRPSRSPKFLLPRIRSQRFRSMSAMFRLSSRRPALRKVFCLKPATVRTEEFINAFDYRDPEATGGAPIAFAWDRARYPFAQDRDLVRFSLKTAASGRQPGRRSILFVAR